MILTPGPGNGTLVTVEQNGGGVMCLGPTDSEIFCFDRARPALKTLAPTPLAEKSPVLPVM